MAPTLKQLTRKHPDYTRAMYDRVETLNAMALGGCKVDEEIKKKLLCNPDGRPQSLIDERVKVARFFPQIGPILNRYISQLFASTPSFEGSKDKFWQELFFSQGCILDGDDNAKTSFTSFLRASTLQMLREGKAIAQVDTRVFLEDGPASKKAIKAAKADEPYVLLVPRCALWDYATDENGFKFAKIAKFKWNRESWDSDPLPSWDFTIYQRQATGKILASRYTVTFTQYKAPKDASIVTPWDMMQLTLDGKTEGQVSIKTELENKELFNLRGRYKFPVVTMAAPHELWLADQLYDAQASFFNQTASLEWALVSANYSMPVVTSDDPDGFAERNRRLGQGYYLTLQTGESINWLDRVGGPFDTSMAYMDKIDGAIDRTLQQIAISADKAPPQSGEVIRQARKPEIVLLETYGAMIREFAKEILDVAAIAHGEDTEWTVEGFSDFEQEDLQVATQEYMGIKQAGVPSETFNKEVSKAYASEVGRQKGIAPKLLTTILEEIDEAEEEEQPAPGQQPPAPQQEGDQEEPEQDEGIPEDPTDEDLDKLIAEAGQ